MDPDGWEVGWASRTAWTQVLKVSGQAHGDSSEDVTRAKVMSLAGPARRLGPLERRAHLSRTARYTDHPACSARPSCGEIGVSILPAFGAPAGRSREDPRRQRPQGQEGPRPSWNQAAGS